MSQDREPGETRWLRLLAYAVLAIIGGAGAGYVPAMRVEETVRTNPHARADAFTASMGDAMENRLRNEHVLIRQELQEFRGLLFQHLSTEQK